MAGTLHRDDTGVAAPESRRSTWTVTVLFAVLALLVGVTIGWLVRGDGSDSSVTTAAETPAAVQVVGADALTERQQQMLTMQDEFIAAAMRHDGDAVVSMFDPNGEVVFTKMGETFRPFNGTLKKMIESNAECFVDPRNDYTVYDPVVVNGDMVITTGVNAGSPFTATTEFAPLGDLVIERYLITW